MLIAKFLESESSLNELSEYMHTSKSEVLQKAIGLLLFAKRLDEVGGKMYAKKGEKYSEILFNSISFKLTYVVFEEKKWKGGD